MTPDKRMNAAHDIKPFLATAIQNVMADLAIGIWTDQPTGG